MTVLSKELREQIIENLTEQMLSCSFGDGLEKEYIRDGFPIFKGYCNFTDEELVKELLGPNHTPTDSSSTQTTHHHRDRLRLLRTNPTIIPIKKTMTLDTIDPTGQDSD